jgi:hypothetical protein
VPVPVPFGEDLAGERVPAAVAECFAHRFGEGVEVVGVLGVDVRVVRELRGDEPDGAAAGVGDDPGAVGGRFDVGLLDGAVPDAARVRAGPDAEDGDVGTSGPKAGVEEVHDRRGGEGPLVEDEELVLAALAGGGLGEVLAVPEHQQAAVAELQVVLLLVPGAGEAVPDRAEAGAELGEEGLFEFGVGAAEQADTDPGVADRGAQPFHEEGEGFPTASGAAVEDVELGRGVEQLLRALAARLGQGQVLRAGLVAGDAVRFVLEISEDGVAGEALPLGGGARPEVGAHGFLLRRW